MPSLRFVVLSAAVFAAGCSSRGGGGDVVPPAVMTLKEVSELLRTSPRAPGKLADLSAGQKAYPRAYDAVKSGEVVVVWGAAMKGEGDSGSGGDVIAYEKGVPGGGGQVLLTSGAVKEMTATEFAAAPKAKK